MKRRTIFELLLVIIILIIAIIKWTSDSNNNDLIDNNLKSTIGLVYETYSTFPDNKYVKYKYIVDNKYYESKTEDGITIKNCVVETNDKFRVEYSISNPSICRLILKCKLHDSIKLGTTNDTIKCINCADN